ncbi:ArnT family glycosyltransferase [Promicromonospora sp. Populi]|uniref:ArnT family glycosyltransferase n=1 Tax=Promicromonospora sp. Populi TaxID=3239420 RepID=UPI0034E22051
MTTVDQKLETAPPDRLDITPARTAPPRTRWEGPAVGALLGVTGLLYLWGLGASGWANDYYAAAVQAGTQSWTAWFFGGLDAGGAITVDKPPAALWVMGLSGRIFGFSTWSMLAPQALMGVGSVALLYATVRRWSGPAVGLFAAAALAVTPVAVLMFRFNNPDALLVLLLVVAAYCVVRACDATTARSGTLWLALAGTAMGFGFLTKMLQAFLVLPAFACVFLLAAHAPLRRRLWQLLVAAGAIVVSAGWWVATVALWPAESRPYIGGSTDNSVLELALGYNGLARLAAEDTGQAAPGTGGGGADDLAAGLGRLFGPGVGEQVAWLLPTALVALVLGLVLTRRAPRTDRARAGLLLWGGWLVVSAVVFSMMGGKFHPYYTVTMVPAIGAVVAITGRELWRRRNTETGRGGLALLAATTGAWAFVLLSRTPDWHPELRYLVAAATLVAIVVSLAGRVMRVGLVAALAAALLGTSGYAIATAAAPHTGAEPTAGPVVEPDDADSDARAAAVGPAAVSVELVEALQATTTRWAAATAGAQSAAPLELASGASVIGIGGFTGTDPAPTLAQFQDYVANGEVTYFIAGGVEEGKTAASRDDAADDDATDDDAAADPADDLTISAWVAENFTATDIGGTTVYDLTEGS